MHWFPFYTADFIAATLELDYDERCAYAWMLVVYYERGGPFPADQTRLFRLLGCESVAQKKAVQEVLRRHFVLTDDGWFNEKAEEVTKKQSERRQRLSNAGRKGGLSSAQARLEPGLKPGSSKLEPEPEPEPDKVKSSCPRPSVADLCPYQKIVDIYHEKLPMLPRVYALTEARKAAIRGRWKDGSCPDLEAWGNFFSLVAGSRFLTGEAKPNGDRKPFRADLEWLTRESNFVKIIEGRYHHA